MNSENIIREMNFLEKTKVSLSKFYYDLNEAVEAQNQQSVYRLSKIITRYHIK